VTSTEHSTQAPTAPRFARAGGTDEDSGIPLLDARNLSKRFAAVQALDDLSIQVRPGEVLALLGENGAGKSTFLKILAGTQRADTGMMILGGERYDPHNPRDARDAGVALIHQELALVPQLDAAGNAFLGRELTSGRGPALARREMRRRMKEVVERLGLDVPVTQAVGTLPMAQRQGVEIAKALLFDVRVLAMDEPTSSLSSHEIERLFEVIRKLRSEGTGILYVSHRLDELPEIADRATVMRDGKLVGTVDMKDTSRDQLVRMMVGRELAELEVRHRKPRAGAALEVRGVKRVGVLHDASLKVAPGEVLGIAGLVGAGRTELLRAIFGADPIDEGEILVHGKPIKPSIERCIAAGMGLVPEDRKGQALIPMMDVKSNVALSSWRRFITRGGWLRKGFRREKVREVTEELDVRPANPDLRVTLLSGGNQQKGVLARWVLAGAKVLLLDEPTRGVDVGAKVEIYRLIERLAGEGAAVVVVSSELSEVLTVSDRILVMREGHIVGELSREEATEEAIINYATGGTQ
jgi:ribose transport system ATP-binding protein